MDVTKIHPTYSDVPSGERVALFNHMGLLEIAIHHGAEGSEVGRAIVRPQGRRHRAH